MINNDRRDLLSFGSSMGCYLSLAKVYLEVAFDIVHLSKKDNDLIMNSSFMILYYAQDINVMFMTLYVMIMPIVD